MKNKIIIFSLFCLLTVSTLFAGTFEGVMSQELSTPDKGTIVLNWYAQGNNLALMMEYENEKYYFVPQGSSDLLMYSTKVDDINGLFYTIVPTATISSSITDFNAVASSATKSIDGESCKKVNINGSTNGSFFYADNIDVDFGAFSTFFKDNIEMLAFQQLSIKGFPLESRVFNNGALMSSITTLSIERRTIDKSIFTIPSGYKNVTLGE